MQKAPQLSNEVWSIVIGYCDLESLFQIGCTGQRHLALIVRELHSRYRREPTYEEEVSKAFQTYLRELAAGDPVYYVPALCRAIGSKLHLWGTVAAYPTPILQRYVDANLIDHRAVYSDWTATFSECSLKGKDQMAIGQSLRCLPPLLLYRIWQVGFLATADPSLAGEVKPSPAVKRKAEALKRLMGLLTDNVMTVFRSDLVINDRFVLKCFEHGLDNILLYLYDNQRFFQLSISTPELQDLYIMLACDTGSITMFLHFVKKIRRIHIEYAMKNASNDFLMIVWKSRAYIPHFHEYIQSIRDEKEEQSIASRDFKQRRFLEWCTTHP